jgi:predicted nucleic acid-binding protein
MKVALDASVLAYAEGVNGTPMKKIALGILEKLPQNLVVLPVQVLGELFQVLVRKAGRTPRQARDAVLGWRCAQNRWAKNSEAEKQRSRTVAGQVEWFPTLRSSSSTFMGAARRFLSVRCCRR